MTAAARSSKSTPSTIVRVRPHARSHTLLFRTPPCLLVRSRQATPNLGTGRGALADRPKQHPRIKQKSDITADRHSRDDGRMSKLNARPVDPRDQRWEVWTPRYRVHF